MEDIWLILVLQVINEAKNIDEEKGPKSFVLYLTNSPSVVFTTSVYHYMYINIYVE